MTSIHGVDPIIVNNIKVQTQKSVVIETQKTKVSDDNKKDKKEQDKEHRQPHMQDLVVAVEKLNKLLEQNKIRLCFQIVNDRGVIRVQLIEIDSGNVVSEIQPEKAFELLLKFNTTGFTINELI